MVNRVGSENAAIYNTAAQCYNHNFVWLSVMYYLLISLYSIRCWMHGVFHYNLRLASSQRAFTMVRLWQSILKQRGSVERSLLRRLDVLHGLGLHISHTAETLCVDKHPG